MGTQEPVASTRLRDIQSLRDSYRATCARFPISGNRPRIGDELHQ